MTKEEILERIDMIASEMDANDMENRFFQQEINELYEQLDSMG